MVSGWPDPNLSLNMNVPNYFLSPKMDTRPRMACNKHSDVPTSVNHVMVSKW